MADKSLKRVLVAAGGTGGHIFPGLAVAEALEKRGVEIFWIGAKGDLVKELVPEKFHPQFISAQGVRGKSFTTLLKMPWMLLRSIGQAYRLLRTLKPDVVLAMGGYVSGPVGIAAKLARIPLVVHEQNSIAGMTNRYLAKLACCVLQAFPGAFPENARVKTIGNPVRETILNMSEPAVRFQGRTGPLRLLILGGSQGVHYMNDVLPPVLAALPASVRPDIWHQAGKRHFEETQKRYENHQCPAKVTAFIEDMKVAYEWADLVVARSGALTVSEIAAGGVPSIFIPFPFAVDNHQYHNARFLEGAQAALIMEENRFDRERFVAWLTEWAHDRTPLLNMAKAAKQQARPQAVKAAVDFLNSFSYHGRPLQ